MYVLRIRIVVRTYVLFGGPLGFPGVVSGEILPLVIAITSWTDAPRWREIGFLHPFHHIFDKSLAGVAWAARLCWVVDLDTVCGHA